MAPKRTTSSSINDQEDEQEDVERWSVPEVFLGLFIKRFPKLKNSTSFPSSSLWKDLYKILISTTVKKFDYKGFPTKTSFKKHGNTFPNTSTADKDDLRVKSIMDNFVLQFGDNIQDLVDTYITGNTSDVSNYIWNDEQTLTKSNTDMVSKENTLDDTNVLSNLDIPENQAVTKGRSGNYIFSMVISGGVTTKCRCCMIFLRFFALFNIFVQQF